MPHKSNLAVVPEVTHVVAAGNLDAENELLSLLDRHVKHTQISLIAREQDVMLFKNLRVQGVYRLSTVALEHLCSRLAPGLHQAIHHISGLRCEKRSVDRNILYSDEVAVAIINRLIRLRFNNLVGYRMIINHSTKMVDGLVGRNYEFFSNRDLYHLATDFVRSQYPQATFHEALLQGRKLTFRLLDPRSFALALPGYGREVFFRGFHFGNAEIGGYSLRVANFLLHSRTSALAVSPFVNGGKLTHAQNQRFLAQVKVLLTRSIRKVVTVERMAEWLIRLANTPVGLVAGDEVVESRKESIAGQLQHRGLTREIAEAVISRAILSKGDSKTMLWAGADLSRDRTAYDVFLALMTEAKDQRFKRREHLEQVAYELLSGSLGLSVAPALSAGS